MTKDKPVTEFTMEDIEDVRIIIKAKGNHFSIIPKEKDLTIDEARLMRIGMTKLLLEFHFVVSTSLEDLKLTNQ